jgi:hypothetical protein
MRDVSQENTVSRKKGDQQDENSDTACQGSQFRWLCT